MNGDARRYAPAVPRNREPILEVLRPYLPSRGLVLEVASGSGEHVTYFAKASAADLIFQPSDPDPGARASIDAWTAALGLHNIRPALALDAASEVWPIASADSVVCINMIHITPWAATVGLMRGAAAVLPFGGLLYVYWAFPSRRPPHGAEQSSLRSRPPNERSAWGVRDIEAVATLAAAHGFAGPLVKEMPANNLSLFFERRA